MRGPGKLDGVFVVRPCPWWQLHPRMSATVIDRSSRWRKAWISEGTYGDTHRRLFTAFFGMEHCCPAHRAESELEPGSLVADSHVLGCGAEDLIGTSESGQRREHTTGPTLTGEAVANANTEGFPINFDAQLAAGTRGGSRTHSAPHGRLLADRQRSGTADMRTELPATRRNCGRWPASGARLPHHLRRDHHDHPGPRLPDRPHGPLIVAALHLPGSSVGTYRTTEAIG